MTYKPHYDDPLDLLKSFAKILYIFRHFGLILLEKSLTNE